MSDIMGNDSHTYIKEGGAVAKAREERLKRAALAMAEKEAKKKAKEEEKSKEKANEAAEETEKAREKAEKEAREKAEKLLASVGLADRLKHRPNELSGGEQQRAAIARALINDPDLLLADEPTGNLDSKTGEEVISLFEDLRKRNPNLTILMITHNRELAANADKTVELIDGLLV